MQQAQVLSMTVSATRHGADIAPLTHREAGPMAAEELRRFIALIETLDPADWDKPTACTLWSVKDVVSHQAAHVSGTKSVGAFIGQQSPRLLRPYRQRGLSMLDAWNQSQVDMRRNTPPEAIVAEIRNGAERSLRTRDRLPALLRAPRLPLPDMDQARSLGYLFDTIYTRDMWMHRHDIYSAIGREMPLEPVHDGRIVALIALDLGEKSRKGLGGRSALLRLKGPAGGTWAIGAGGVSDVTVEMDTMTFCVLTSGRSRADAVLESEPITIEGDAAFGRDLVRYFENRVLY